MTTNNSKEYILCAAVKPEDRPPIAGYRHSDIYQMIKHYEVLSREDSVKAEPGFLTSKGRFVFRDIAYKIALAAGQIERNPKRSFLLSEDLY